MSEWPRRFRRTLEAACVPDTPDVDDVVAALGLVYANGVLGRSSPDAALTDRLWERGSTCLASLAQEVLETGDPEGQARLLLAIAKVGLDVLRAERTELDVTSFAEAFTPDASRVAQLLSCRLEGVAAARCAAALVRDPDALERARSLSRVLDSSFEQLHRDLSAEEPMEGAANPPSAPHRLRVAASDVRALWDPSEGRVIGCLREPVLEAVLFERDSELHLALYAAEPDTLRLEADGATTEDMQPGYWLGRLDRGEGSLEAKVYCADRELSWTLVLSPNS